MQFKGQPACVYCGEHCWKLIHTKRFDGMNILATCPNGKVMDMCCEVIAEAEYNVKRRIYPHWPPELGDY